MKTLFTSFLILLSLCVTAQDEVQIGNQIWMKYNLITEAGVWPGGTQANAQYGKLYTWAEAQDACPSGWHLPTKAEWRVLDSVAGDTLLPDGRTAMAGTSGRNLKLAGFTYWYNPYTYGGNTPYNQRCAAAIAGLDIFGFSALPAGMGYGNAFYNLGKNAYFWTSTDEGVFSIER